MQDLLDTYPFNLAIEILGDNDKALKIYVPGIYAALSMLTEREQSVLNYRFDDHLTFRDCAKKYCITTERIRQIQVKALRKLRHPSRKSLFIAVPLAEVQEQDIKYQKICREYETLAKAFEVKTGKPAEHDVIVPMADIAIQRRTPIEELDFSVRTYNCLSRAGKKTLGELADMTEDDLKKVRNLGNKSIKEVIECVKNRIGA